jgi:Leishmanolysin
MKSTIAAHGGNPNNTEVGNKSDVDVKKKREKKKLFQRCRRRRRTKNTPLLLLLLDSSGGGGGGCSRKQKRRRRSRRWTCRDAATATTTTTRTTTALATMLLLLRNRFLLLFHHRSYNSNNCCAVALFLVLLMLLPPQQAHSVPQTTTTTSVRPKPTATSTRAALAPRALQQQQQQQHPQSQRRMLFFLAPCSPLQSYWFRRRQEDRCAILSLGNVMHRGTPGQADCVERCVTIASALYSWFRSLFNVAASSSSDHRRLQCGSCGTAVTPTSHPSVQPSSGPSVSMQPSTSAAPSSRPTTTEEGRYNITLGFGSAVPQRDRHYFYRAQQRWESTITGNLNRFNSSRLLDPPADPACQYPAPYIDDIYICCVYATNDGPGGVLAHASPDYVRGSNGLTISGTIFVDAADAPSITTPATGSNYFNTVILHEMLHVIGFGSLFPSKGLIQNTGTNSSNCTYLGKRANSEYETITGCPVVPLDQTGGVGTRCGHWDESCLPTELMSGVLEDSSGAAPLLSRITVAAMEDLGYAVNYTSADPYGAGDVCSCNNSSRRNRSRRQEHATNVRFLGTVDVQPHSSALGPLHGANRTPHRLNETIRLHAVQSAQSILRGRRNKHNTHRGVDGDSSSGISDQDEAPPKYVGADRVAVLVRDGNALFSIVVSAD